MLHRHVPCNDIWANDKPRIWQRSHEFIVEPNFLWERERCVVQMDVFPWWEQHLWGLAVDALSPAAPNLEHTGYVPIGWPPTRFRAEEPVPQLHILRG